MLKASPSRETRKVVIQREPFLGKFVARFEPPLVGDQPKRFHSHDEAVAYGIAVQKDQGVVLLDLCA